MLFLTKTWTTSQPTLRPRWRAIQTPPAVEQCAPKSMRQFMGITSLCLSPRLPSSIAYGGSDCGAFLDRRARDWAGGPGAACPMGNHFRCLLDESVKEGLRISRMAAAEVTRV
jgi:hypothetical protein